LLAHPWLMSQHRSAVRFMMGYMRASIILVAFLALAAPPAKTLDIYVIDVEGGNATLFVSPSGESLLIDFPACLSPTRLTTRSLRCPSLPCLRRNPERAPQPSPFTTEPHFGSNCLRNKTVHLPSTPERFQQDLQAPPILTNK
jgi:hypothetical protein